MRRRPKPEPPICRSIELAQPRASLLIARKIEVVNLWMPPKPELVGTRIAIVAGPLNHHDLWMLPELYGLELPEGWRQRGFRTGVIGSAVLRGWVRAGRGGKVLEQHRPGNSAPFRKLRTLSGPFGWVFRQPSDAKLPTSPTTEIRAGYHDQPIVQRHLVWYAGKYGTRNLTAENLAQLVEAEPKWRGRLGDYNGEYGRAVNSEPAKERR